VLEVLKERFGLIKVARHTRRHHDLDDLFGRWSEEEYQRIEEIPIFPMSCMGAASSISSQRIFLSSMIVTTMMGTSAQWGIPRTIRIRVMPSMVGIL